VQKNLAGNLLLRNIPLIHTKCNIRGNLQKTRLPSLASALKLVAAHVDVEASPWALFCLYKRRNIYIKPLHIVPIMPINHDQPLHVVVVSD
jgi:hypothetical protein